MPDLDRKILIASAVVLLLFLSVIQLPDSERSDLRTTELAITNGEGEVVTVEAEIAKTDDERSQGLMNRENLCGNCGMLFVYEENTTGSFWMKNTRIPLSIAFLGPQGRIIDIQQMEPNTLTRHSPSNQYRYALEVNQGFYQERNVEKGDSIKIPEKMLSS